MASLDVVDKIATKPATTNTTTKPNKQKRKIEIKKVEQKNKRHVAFSKRKQGLINKVTELSLLCQAKTALIITTPNGKFYACGYPTPDTVIQDFLAGENPFSPNQQEKQEDEKVAIETLRFRYEALQDQLKEEKKKLQALTKAHNSGSCSSSWWNLSIEDMSFEDLDLFKTSLEHLKLNIVTAMEAKIFSSLEPLPLAVSPSPPRLSSYSLLSEEFLEQQVNYNDTAFASFMLPDSFGHYY